MNVSAGISTTFKPTRNLVLTNVAIKNYTDVFARTTLVLAVHGKGESFNIATMRVGAVCILYLALHGPDRRNKAGPYSNPHSTRQGYRM